MLDFIDYANATTTVIDIKSIIDGGLKTSGVVEVKGQIDGEVEVSGLVSVYGIINGKIMANDLICRSFSNIYGDIVVSNDLFLEPESLITGNVKSCNMELFGKIEGDIYTEETLIVRKGAIVDGNVKCRTLVVDDGGKVNGFVDLIYNYRDEMI